MSQPPVSVPAQDPSVIRFTAHPPERGLPGKSVTLAVGGCCCCCCCCLHTIGGIIGGVTGSLRPIDHQPREILDPDFPFPFRRDEEEIIDTGLPPNLLYWLLVGFLIGLTAVISYVAEGTYNPNSLGVGLFVAVMILPALQLGASLLAAIAIGLFYPDRGEALARIGKITWWSFAGSMIGLVAMGGCCGMFGLFR